MRDLQELPTVATTHLKRKTNGISSVTHTFHINTFHTTYFIHIVYKTNAKTHKAYSNNDRQQNPAALC
jgi:hypothetical protein